MTTFVVVVIVVVVVVVAASDVLAFPMRIRNGFFRP
jgi:hypothetical protein